MRSVTVVCDHHQDRPAVATYYVSAVALDIEADRRLTPGGSR